MSFKQILVDLDLYGNKLHNSVIGSNIYATEGATLMIDGAISYGTNGLVLTDNGTLKTIIHSGNG